MQGLWIDSGRCTWKRKGCMGCIKIFNIMKGLEQRWKETGPIEEGVKSRSMQNEDDQPKNEKHHEEKQHMQWVIKIWNELLWAGMKVALQQRSKGN